jgi:hypothetical protein
MAVAIVFARGWLPGVVPYRATGLRARRPSWRRRHSLPGTGRFRTSGGNGPPWSCSWLNNRGCPTARLPSGGSARRVRCAVGDPVGPRGPVPWQTRRDGGARPLFPPLDHAVVQAVAGARVADTTPPLRRQALAAVTARGRPVLGPPLSRSPVGRRLATAAITPGRDKDGIVPRAPPCADQAGPRLDLSAGRWHGAPRGPQDHRRSADEQPRLPARRRCPPSRPPAPGRAASSEHAYERGGARPSRAAGAGRRGDVLGRCAPTTGIAPCGRRGQPGLAEEPSRAGARRLWRVDNGSSPRGAAAKKRRRQVDARSMLVQTPVPASGRQQVDLSFSILQRKVWTPKDCADWEALRLCLALSAELSHPHPTPLQWQCDRATLTAG